MFSRLFGAKKQKKVQTPRPPRPKSDQEKIDEKLKRAVGVHTVGKETDGERIVRVLEKLDNPVKGDQFLTLDHCQRIASELELDGVTVLRDGRLLTSYGLMKRARDLGLPTESSHEWMYGETNPVAECIFCGAVGGVRVKVAAVTETHRINSVAGAALGVGVNSQKNKIQRHCDKCSKTWHE